MAAMETAVHLNGEVVPPDEARISIFDHGFLFGDSVYEVIRTVGRRPYQLGPHLDRLRSSAEKIDLPIPFSDADFEEVLRTTLEAREAGDSACRIIVTRGVGPLRLDPSPCHEPNRILIAYPLPRWPEVFYQEGLNLKIVTRERMSPTALNPGAKTGNYLNNMLAHVEAKHHGADEALMLNKAGRVTECPTSNIFWVTEEGTLRTPALASGILSGITRRTVLEMAEAEGLEVEEGEFGPDELAGAKEVFITSTTRGVMPVRAVSDHRFAVPGPVTERLKARLDADIESLRTSE